MNKREELERKWRRIENIILLLNLPIAVAYIAIGVKLLFE